MDVSGLDDLIDSAAQALLGVQQDDGHWVFELEADATIPSEYVFLRHFLGQPDSDLEPLIGNYLREKQLAGGGWPLFHDGKMDISASVKAYFALKIIGDSPDDPHMVKARKAIHAAGGAESANVFTRTMLCLFGQLPWRAVPVMPVEVMMLPDWFPFHMSKVSYWSRTVIAPLLIVMALKPQAKNPRNVDIHELFVRKPSTIRNFNTNPTGSSLGEVFVTLDKVLQKTEPLWPKGTRRNDAIAKAEAFIRERLNGEDGLGGIFPAMAFAVMAFDALGYKHDHPDFQIALKSIQKLLVIDRDQNRAYCQPCLSPVWDTCLAAHAVLESDTKQGRKAVQASLDWLADRQILDVRGDWAERAKGVSPGGWAFQYRNDHYPDVDDTAVVMMAMHRHDAKRYAEPLSRATTWILGMQSKQGGWGAFDVDNTHDYLNSIPFADHGALLDPPTADVTARCLSALAQIGFGSHHPVMKKGLDYLKREQEKDGSWFGRWGVNYVYGTWSVLCALNVMGEDPKEPYIQRAVAWLKAQQQDDGGWGEDCATYWQQHRGLVKGSTPSQTSWALLGLMAAGAVDDPAVTKGIQYLQDAPKAADGVRWEEELYTGGGFPRVFYLKYHGYAAYFPLWALSRYRNLMAGNDKHTPWGM
ncbi:MAG: squalene--hopene cyclase [Pseudomonadota bacterium]